MVPKAMPHKATSLLSTLQDALPSSAYAALKAIAEKASQLGMPLYLVGGSLRDILLGQPIRDLDLVAEGDATALAMEASKELGGDVLSHSQFGTATLRLSGQHFDLTTARHETYSRPGALPRVTPSSIGRDLARRDFSVNAMAIALVGPEEGRLLDPLGGQKDLARGLVRVLHSGSFVDDATRILRAVRYEQRYGFNLERETHRLLLEALEARMLDMVSGDRIRRELELTFQEEHPHRALRRCGELGVLQAIYPPICDGAGVTSLEGHAIESCPLWYLAALSYPLSAQEGESFIRRLRMPARWARVVRDAIAVRQSSEGAPASPRYIGDPTLSPGELCSFLDQLSPVSVQIGSLLSESPQVRESLERYLTRWRYVKPTLNGKDLISLGVPEGPLVGEVLRQLRWARLEARATSRDDEIRLAKEYISSRGA